MEPYPADSGRRGDAPRRRRRYSIWTVLAPIGLIVFVIFSVSALSNSCVGHGNCTKKKTDTASAKPANAFKSGTKAKVQKGQSMGSIAAKYNLTVADLQACNPTIDSQALQPGQRLNVSAIDCEGQDLAPAGANPDPLAGGTSATGTAAAKAKAAAAAKAATAAKAAAESQNNGTAAADPTAGTATTATNAGH
jgi:hypothetical protein